MESEQMWARRAEWIAREAGALLRGFYERGVATEYKGDVDLVTEADRASEALIKEAAGRRRFRSRASTAKRGRGSGSAAEYRWYVDPLDGTTNFAHGFPAVLRGAGAVSGEAASGLATDEDGEMVAGVIYDPLRDEMFTAERGRGSVAERAAIAVSKTAKLQEALTATGFPIVTSGTGRRTCTSTRSSRCARMGCGGRGRLRSILRMWRAGVWTGSGSSI